MAKQSFLFAAFVCICFTLQGAASFSLNKVNGAQAQQQSTAIKNRIQSPVPSVSDKDESSTLQIVAKSIGNDNNNLKQSLFAGCIAFLTTTPLSAFADSIDDMEIAELPPVYVPILFAIGIIGGVGVLTASLGNVMDEEASLGLQSGARAKKERDRTRSSYFKK